jgi:hypothetical protein
VGEDERREKRRFERMVGNLFRSAASSSPLSSMYCRMEVFCSSKYVFRSVIRVFS